MSPTRFFLVVIKDKRSNKYFYGKVPIFLNLTPVETFENFLNFKGKDGVCPYKVLTEVTDRENNKDWFKNYSVTTFRQKSYSLDEVNMVIYKSQLKVIEKYGGECILNDRVIGPKKVKCGCGLMILESRMEMHKEKYCRLNEIDLDLE